MFFKILPDGLIILLAAAQIKWREILDDTIYRAFEDGGRGQPRLATHRNPVALAPVRITIVLVNGQNRPIFDTRASPKPPVGKIKILDRVGYKAVVSDRIQRPTSDLRTTLLSSLEPDVRPPSRCRGQQELI